MLARLRNFTSWKRVLINAFILFHLLMFLFWGLPGSRFRTHLTRWLQDYVVFAGLWHSWDMFSPDPLSVNFHLEALITFADGSKKSWEFPRMEKLGLWERFQKERYRKWRERVRQDAYSAIWDDTARYIARLNNQPTNPPVEVVLIRHWQPIAPPKMQFSTDAAVPPFTLDYQPMPSKFDLKFNYRFKIYVVNPEDLK